MAIGNGVVADLFECGDGGKNAAIATVGARFEGCSGNETVEYCLIQTDLFGRHRTMVKLIDTVGKFCGNSRFGLCASEHKDAIEGAKCTFALIATSGAGGGKLRNELRSRSDEAGIGEIENCPKVTQSVFDRSTGERES